MPERIWAPLLEGEKAVGIFGVMFTGLYCHFFLLAEGECMVVDFNNNYYFYGGDYIYGNVSFI